MPEMHRFAPAIQQESVKTVFDCHADLINGSHEYTLALKLYEELNDVFGQTSVLGRMGNLYYVGNDKKRAELYYLKALELYFNTSESDKMRLQDNGKELYNKKFSIAACASAYDNLYHVHNKVQ